MDSIADKKMEVAIGRMLRFGVFASAAVVFVGGVLFLANSAARVPDYTHFHATALSLRTPSGVIHGVLELDAQSIVQLGIMLLIATPVMRVIFCFVGFSLQRDRLYIAISTAVFVILIYSLVRGGR
jgi:uncharacterized membrane protein